MDFRFGRRMVLGAIGTGIPAIGLARPARSRSVDAALKIVSPDGRLNLHLEPPTRSLPPRWLASIGEKRVVGPGMLALRLQDGSLLGPGAILLGAVPSRHDEVWHPPFGANAEFDASHRQLTARFRDAKRGITFAIILRAYDHGLAVRYRIESAPGGSIALAGEETEFAFPPGAQIWSSRDEGEYLASDPTGMNPVPDPPLTRSSDSGPLADLPLTVLMADGIALSIAEADRFGYPRLAFRPGPGIHSVSSRLMRFPARATGYSGPGDTPPEMSFVVSAGSSTPWRVVTVARSQTELVDRSGLPAVLASPSRLPDAEWIKPGKAIRVRTPYTTERALACIDFARRHKLRHILFDAHWYGDGTDPSDASLPIPGLDIEKVVRAGRDVGVGTLVYVDRVPAMRQLPQILSAYRAWGIEGIKFGFMWEGRQSDVRFVEHLVSECGRAGLMVCLHDDLRPSGMERTWPNYVSLEGVRGNEHFPTPRHNVTLPFTRNVAGPIDYTICYAQARNKTTNAHQLAMAAVYYCPLTLLYWYDEPAKFDAGAWPELVWFDECPTVWDETRALSGAIGEHVIVARRSGRRWFVGAMTNEHSREVRLSLDFLGAGAWKAVIFGDGERALEAWRTPVVRRDLMVSSTGHIDLALAGSGGAAVMLSPA